MTDKKRIVIYVDEELYKRIKSMAALYHRSVSWYVGWIIEKHLGLM